MPFKKIYLLVLLLIFIALNPISILAHPQAKPGGVDAEYDALKSKYMRLRNTDPNIRKKSEWTSTISSLEKFSNSTPSSPHADLALLQAASMHIAMYEALKDGSDLDRAVELLVVIPQRFPKGDQADDALYKLADIQSGILGDKSSAEKNLKYIVDNYSSGDMYEAASIKLKTLEIVEEVEEDREEVKEEVKEEKALTGTQALVVLDPGHGGDDFGAVGVGGLYEKDVVLDVSKKVKDILKKKYGIDAMLTRDSDDFVPLYQRTEFANQNKSKIFVSIHANASEKSNLKGMEIYYLDNTSDQGSKKLAERENASLQFEGPEADLRYMLSDLIQDTKIKDSIALGKLLSKEILEHVSEIGTYKLKNLGVKKGPFYVLVGAHMPCVLVELAFIDHPEEGKMLAEKNFRANLSESIAKGIAEFLK